VAVGLLHRLLDPLDGLVGGQHAGELEEAGLHHGVDAVAHAHVARHPVGVDDPELDLLVDELLLHVAGEPVPHLVGAVRAVEQERGAALGAGEDRHPLHQPELVTGDEVGVLDEVGGPDRARTEPQVGHRHRSRLLGVVDEVALGPQIRALADDLHRCLVGPHRPVGSQPEEHGLHLAVGSSGTELSVDLEAEVGDVVVDAHGEVASRPVRAQLVEDRADHRRRELLRRQAVAAPDDARPLGERSWLSVTRLVQGGDDVEVERLAERTGFLGPVEHRDRADGRG
jgi:hypothetical protein